MSPKVRMPGQLHDVPHKSHEVASSDIVEKPIKKKYLTKEGDHSGKKKKSCGGWFYTVLSWPISILLKITIPQPRRMGKCPAGCMTVSLCKCYRFIWTPTTTFRRSSS